MTAADLVLHGARLLTLAPLREERPRVGPAAGDVGAVMDGFVAARDGAIVATGHGAALQTVERVEDAVDVDVHGRVVMPGFVDPHTHLCYAGERWEEFASRRSGADYLAVLAAGGGIHATVRATREATDEQLLTLLRRRIGDAVELGTTTIEVKSGYGLEPDRCADRCRRHVSRRARAAGAVYRRSQTVHPRRDERDRGDRRWEPRRGGRCVRGEGCVRCGRRSSTLRCGEEGRPRGDDACRPAERCRRVGVCRADARPLR